MATKAQHRKQVWESGEDLAASYLVSIGWEILARNWRCPSGEIDIIAKDRDQVVVFCEVKSRCSDSYGPALEAITIKKMKKLREVAIFWLREQPKYTPVFRFDGIGVLFASGPAKITHKQGIGL